FTYSDQSNRDPFSPSTAELQPANSGPRPDENRAKEPLEMFALDSLKMVGAEGGGASMEVLVKDPSGVIHRVQRNEPMGHSYGRGTVISEVHIGLVQLVSNGNGC